MATGIDFALKAGGRISGKVTDIATGAPLSDVTLEIYDSEEAFVARGTTDGAGRYISGTGLPSGNFYARTADSAGYLNQLYSGIGCVDNCDPLKGSPISVTIGIVAEGVDFGLMAGGRISGKVTRAEAGSPIPNVRVTIYDAAQVAVLFAYTDTSGNYISGRGLAAGTYSQQPLARQILLIKSMAQRHLFSLQPNIRDANLSKARFNYIRH